MLRTVYVIQPCYQKQIKQMTDLHSIQDRLIPSNRLQTSQCFPLVLLLLPLRTKHCTV